MVARPRHRESRGHPRLRAVRDRRGTQRGVIAAVARGPATPGRTDRGGARATTDHPGLFHVRRAIGRDRRRPARAGATVVKVGVLLPTFRPRADDALGAADEAARCGIDGVFAYDHLWPGPPRAAIARAVPPARRR